MSDDSGPIRSDELNGLFAPLGNFDSRIGLAVSGGSDSTALMVLFADWLARNGAEPSLHTVLTIDHRLRPESGAEAEAVVRHAAGLGFRHATLVWEGPKPQTGLQVAARAARHRLLASYASTHGIPRLLTAHTTDDQAETLLMRLARGSGVDGLAAMAAHTVFSTPEGPSLTIIRPLLEVPKARLRATLEQRGIAWIEDPSNQSPAFERTRLRAARAELEALGLTTGMLALSARARCRRRARAALERWVDDVCNPDRALFHADACGFVRIDGPALRALPLEVALRVILRAIALAGGSGVPLPLAGLEPIAEAIVTGPAAAAWTLARAKISAGPAHVVVEREPPRTALPTLTLEPGTQACWDGRFLVRAGPGLAAGVQVRALGEEGLRGLRPLVAMPSRVPSGALRVLPAFWRGAGLIAVPSLGFWAEEGLQCELAATFPLPGTYNATPLPDDPPSP